MTRLARFAADHHLALPLGAAIVIMADHLRRVLFERPGARSSEPRSS